MESEVRQACAQLVEEFNQSFHPGPFLNKQLKLVEVIASQISKDPEQFGTISTQNNSFQEFLTEGFIRVLESLGFRRGENAMVFRGEIEEIRTNYPKLIEILQEYRYLSLADIADIISKGQKPPGIKEVNDKPIEGSATPSELLRPTKPWEKNLQ